jgi:hypothetical protein
MTGRSFLAEKAINVIAGLVPATHIFDIVEES